MQPVLSTDIQYVIDRILTQATREELVEYIKCRLAEYDVHRMAVYELEKEGFIKFENYLWAVEKALKEHRKNKRGDL
jgi:hypothetical protein